MSGGADGRPRVFVAISRSSGGGANDGWLPGAVQDRLSAPIGSDVQGEMAIRRRQPVGFLIGPGRLAADVEREGAVGAALERLVLRAERIALERVGMEEVLVVVEGERPEAVNRRLLPGGEGHLIAARSLELR